jgi:small subunit ribosomal protein S6
LPYYESVFIARQDVAQPQVDALTDTFTKVVTDLGGKVTKKEYWGLRGLSFRIKKNRKGHYVLMNLDAPPAAVHEMERQMRINEDVLRYLTVRVEELEEGPSAMLQSRNQREDRPRREFGDRPRRDYDDRPRRDYDDRPRRDYDDRPRRGRDGDDQRSPAHAAEANEGGRS